MNGNTRRWVDPDAMADQDDRATHPIFFADFTERHGPFTLDVAAAAHNTKCARYFTRADDGVVQDWTGERVWCNPPYSDIAPWVAKAWEAREATLGVAMLLPANRTEQGWWQTMVEPYRDRPGSPLRTEFIASRIRFLRPGQTAVGPGERPPFGCVLLVWAPGPAELVYAADRVAGGLFGADDRESVGPLYEPDDFFDELDDDELDDFDEDYLAGFTGDADIRIRTRSRGRPIEDAVVSEAYL